jgi:hypothetical protein
MAIYSNLLQFQGKFNVVKITEVSNGSKLRRFLFFNIALKLY